MFFKRHIEYSKILEEVTGIKPPEEIVQEAYVAYMRNRDFDNLNALREATGFKPWEEVYHRLKLKNLWID